MDILKIYILDIVLGLIFALSVVYYYRKGFARSVLEFFSFFAAAITTRLFYDDFAKFILEKTTFFQNDAFPQQKAKIVSIILLFIAATILIKYLIKVIDKLFKLPLVKTANKALGLVIGVICGFLIVTAVCLVMNVLVMTDNELVVNAVNNSKIMEIDSQLVDLIFPEISKMI